MDNCQFCHNQYQSRPQVKKPRACTNCQEYRQRSNEKDWRIRNPKYSCPLYHKLRRQERIRKLKAAAASLLKCLKVGKEMMGMTLAMDVFEMLLEDFLLGLGIRRVNKFWISEIAV